MIPTSQDLEDRGEVGVTGVHGGVSGLGEGSRGGGEEDGRWGRQIQAAFSGRAASK